MTLPNINLNFSNNGGRQFVLSSMLFIIVLVKIQMFSENEIILGFRKINFWSVIGYNPRTSELNSTEKEILFREMVAVRRTISAVILMSASTESRSWKTNFLNESINFLKERLIVLINLTSKIRSSVSYDELVQLENTIISLQSILTKYYATALDSENFDLFAENFLIKLGGWYDKLKQKYGVEMGRIRNECLHNMNELEKNISHQLYQVQQGELCEKSTSVLYFRDPTI